VTGGLLARLAAPTTFVVGKGGVGKTTTAGALALALADAGQPTHLVSTDPAHSVGDLFRQPVHRDGSVSRCCGALRLEELDAEEVARVRLAGFDPALRDLIDRGTYLDLEDAETLLGGVIPGLYEIGAALRIAELAGSGVRLVVDTAPTGHTLRLLDAEPTARRWLEALEAMAAKADAVAIALVGRAPPLPGEAVIRELDDALVAFSAAVRKADFLIVTGPGAVVAAETRRLRNELERRGLRTAATVAVARPGAEADALLPFRPGLADCEPLRSWWRDGTGASPAVAGATVPATASARERLGPGPLPGFLDRELLVVAGKGGVGKTTTAAALAVRLARDGPVVALGADPAGSLADVIGAAVPGLRIEESDAMAELDRLRHRYRIETEQAFVAAGLHGGASLDEAVVRSLLGATPPGLDELVAVGRLLQDTPRGARVVLDTAPTGHFLRLLAMPGEALDWTHRLMRVLLKYQALRGLDALAESLLRLARRLRGLRERLADPARTAILVVTLDEPVVAAETERLIGQLRGMHLTPAAVLVNHAAGGRGFEAPEYVAELPVFALPTVPEPTGAAALLSFIDSWERVA
jgi:arsenite/tail-anchored protein-transporting ATPase